MVAPFPKPDTLVDPEFDLSQIHGACQIGESTKSGGGDDAHYGPGRACLVAASAVSAVNAAIAARVRMAATLQRREAMMDCVVMNRLTMSCPGSKGLSSDLPHPRPKADNGVERSGVPTISKASRNHA